MNPGSASVAVFVALTFFAALGPASAQTTNEQMASLAGTVSVGFVPDMNQGQLTGCELLFTVLQQDQLYGSGGFFKISGDVAFLATKAQVGVLLKLGASALDTSGSSLRQTPLQLSKLYLLAPDLTTNLNSQVTTVAGELPGTLVSVFNFQPSFDIVTAALKSNRLTIAFSLVGGAIDDEVLVALNVVGVGADGRPQNSEQPKNDFIACAETLLDQTIRKLK